MTDSVARILVNAKRVFKTKDNNLKYIVIADDENGKEINYILNFNYDGITLGRTIVNNNKIEVITNNQEYDRNLFLSILVNYNILVGNINEFNNTVNFTLNTIPAMVFSNSVFKKGVLFNSIEEEIYAGDKYIDDFIAYNNINNLIDSNNYFTFLKFTVEAGNLQIFDYLRFTYNEYMNNLNEEQIAILIYTACKRNPAFIEKMHELDFTFGFEVLKLAVDNNDYEVLEYLYNEGIDINAVNNRFQYIPMFAYVTGNYEPRTILDYAIKINNIEMIKYFLAIKDVNIGKTIVLGIVQNPEIIEPLLARDDIIDILKIKEDSNWSVADEIARNENPGVVKLLLKRNDDMVGEILNIRSFKGLSIAHVIANNKNPEVVRLLLERPEMIDILKMKDRNHDISVVDIIIDNKNPEVVKLLFERNNILGEILNITDSEGYSVAHKIANNENFEIVKLLFEIPNILLKTNSTNGYSVAHSITLNKNPEVVKLLFERPEIKKAILKIRSKYSNASIIHTMTYNENPEVIKFLLTREDLKLEKRDINSIKENFSNNEEITNLLLVCGLINANGDIINNKKTCTIC